MKKILLLFSLLLLVCFTNAQNKIQPVVKISTTVAKLVGKTKPLKELIVVPGTAPEKKAMLKKRKQTVINFREKAPANDVNGIALPIGTDPVRQKAVLKTTTSSTEPSLNIDGFNQTNSTNSNPPDPCGAIGREFYIQMVNVTVFKILDKAGNVVVDATSANTLWASLGFASAGDPIILYDQEFDRWFITEFTSSGDLLVAVSETEDPTGSWFVYNFGTPNFPDYPKYAIWKNSLFVTTNEPGSTPAYFLDRMALLGGQAIVPVQRLEIPAVEGGPGFQAATPVHWTGSVLPPDNANALMLRLHDDAWGDVPEDGIEVFEVDIDFYNADNTNIESYFLPTAAFDSNPCSAPGGGLACIPQLDGNGIDGVPEVIMHQVQYRNFCTHESIVLCFIVDATAGQDVSGIRWMELRRTPGTAWSIFQESTFAPDDGKHRFLPSIAMDGDGNIGLGYCVSADDIFPGLAYTGRRATDPPGMMTLEEYTITEGFSASSNVRYGDYSQMVVDPVNEKTFWFTGEYRRAADWGTKIVAFEFQEDIDVAPVRLVAPENASGLSANELLEVEIRNGGLTPQSNFTVGFIFENEPEVTEELSITLQPGELYTHTFSTTVDMSEIGTYDFKIFTALANDEVVTNDTLCDKRKHLPGIDVAVTGIAGFEKLNCTDQGNVFMVIENQGTELLTSADIVVDFNGITLPTINWSGELSPGVSTNVPVFLFNALDGNNTITVTASNPNGQADELPENNFWMETIDLLTEGVEVVFELLTDNYPYETTWELKDSYGNVLLSGGPYLDDSTMFTQTFCLEIDSCYTFSIYDSFGDGTGYYSLSVMGTVVAEGTNFGNEATTDFCPDEFCLLGADIAVTPDSGDGTGSIFITALNEPGDILYSIDGGATFQESHFFFGLPSGIYQVVLQAGTPEDNCTYTELVNIVISSSETLEDQHKIELFPNPTEGVFRINIHGLDHSEPFLDLHIFDASGKLVQPGNLVRYDDTFTGMFSLVTYPAGVYYVRFSGAVKGQLLKVVKH